MPHHSNLPPSPTQQVEDTAEGLADEGLFENRNLINDDMKSAVKDLPEYKARSSALLPPPFI